MNIILGGTHGLGQEIARELRERGEETFVVGRSYNEHEHGKGMTVDLTNDKDVAELRGFINKLGDVRLHGFYWVAGYGYIGNFATQPDVQRMAEVNFSNALPLAQAAWGKMIDQQSSSRFVVISSTSGFKPRKDEAVYAATKHAQKGFAESLGLESERLKSPVKVALFMPGGMHTPFWEGNQPEHFSQFLDPAKVARRIVARVTHQAEYFYEETIERGSL